jgi:hypothetical protein
MAKISGSREIRASMSIPGFELQAAVHDDQLLPTLTRWTHAPIKDETGDRLTPSHAVRRGQRHRYYLSHRLVAQSGEADLSGWRLPAATLEGAAITLIGAVRRMRTSLSLPRRAELQAAPS